MYVYVYVQNLRHKFSFQKSIKIFLMLNMDHFTALLLFLGSYGFLDAVKIYSIDIKSPKAIFKQAFTKNYRILAICITTTDNLVTMQLLWRPLRLSKRF